MGLHLTRDDQARLSAATAVLLAGPTCADPGGWAGDTVEAVRFLFHGDNAALALPGPGGLILAAEALPPDTVDAMRHQVVGVEPGILRMRDADLDRVARLRQRAGLDVYTHATLERAAGPWLREAGFRQELTRPAGMDHFVGLRVPLPMGEAILCVGFASPGEAPFGDDEWLQLAGLLLPAFREGIRTTMGVGAWGRGGRERTGRGPLLPTVRQLSRWHGLTPREAEVALLLARGASDQEAAKHLSISHHTVRKHAEHIFAKLGIHTRKALALRLLDLEPGGSVPGRNS